MGARKSVLTIKMILAWADAHHRRTGAWPNRFTGPIHERPADKWSGVEVGLTKGCRGLPGGITLAQFLQRQRGYRNRANLPPLLIGQILAWADDYLLRTGDWPTKFDADPFPASRGENWSAIDGALSKGQRGLPGGRRLDINKNRAGAGESRGNGERPRRQDVNMGGSVAWAVVAEGREFGSGPV